MCMVEQKHKPRKVRAKRKPHRHRFYEDSKGVPRCMCGKTKVKEGVSKNKDKGQVRRRSLTQQRKMPPARRVH